MITHLESDILECELKWALGSITMNKSSGGDEIPDELFQILTDDTAKVLHSTCQQIWKIQQPTSLEKLVFIPIAQRVTSRDIQTTTQLHLLHMIANNAQNPSSYASTVCEPKTSRC